jgi:hypothetical protein
MIRHLLLAMRTGEYREGGELPVEASPDLGKCGLWRRRGPLQPACAFPRSLRCWRKAKASILNRTGFSGELGL